MSLGWGRTDNVFTPILLVFFLCDGNVHLSLWQHWPLVLNVLWRVLLRTTLASCVIGYMRKLLHVAVCYCEVIVCWQVGEKPTTGLLSGSSRQTDHQLVECTFSSVQLCHICGRPLLGVVRQGHRCRRESLIVCFGSSSVTQSIWLVQIKYSVLCVGLLWHSYVTIVFLCTLSTSPWTDLLFLVYSVQHCSCTRVQLYRLSFVGTHAVT